MLLLVHLTRLKRTREKMEPQEIQVNQFEMKKAKIPHVLYSGGLGPCIAIGVYAPNKRIGYMIHQPHFSHGVNSKNSLLDFIKKIREECMDLSGLKVFATGGSLDVLMNQEDNKNLLEDRKFVTKELRKHFKESSLKIIWGEIDCATELFLDTSTGKFKVVTSYELGEDISEDF